MKKILISIITILMMVNIICCGCTTNDEEDGKNKANSFKITLTDSEENEFNESLGYRVISINITIENTQNEEIWIDAHYFRIVLEDGKKYSPDLLGYLSTGGNIKPGQKQETSLWFEVYSKSDISYLEYDSNNLYTKVYF